MSMWSDIPATIKAILDADLTVQGLVNTIRIGLPARNVSDSDYPIVVIGRCTLTSVDFRGTGKQQDRATVWNCPIFIGYKSTIADIESGAAYTSLDAIEQAVVAAILNDDSFNNESPYYGIELANSELDDETLSPFMGQIYNFEIRKVNSF